MGIGNVAVALVHLAVCANSLSTHLLQDDDEQPNADVNAAFDGLPLKIDGDSPSVRERTVNSYWATGSEGEPDVRTRDVVQRETQGPYEVEIITSEQIKIEDLVVESRVNICPDDQEEMEFHIREGCNSEKLPLPVAPLPKPDFEGTALTQFTASSGEELSLQPGDKLLVQPSHPAPPSWWFAKKGDTQGYVPRKLVTPPPGGLAPDVPPPQHSTLEDAQITLMLQSGRPFHLDKVELLSGAGVHPCTNASLQRAEPKFAGFGMHREFAWKTAVVLEPENKSKIVGAYDNPPGPKGALGFQTREPEAGAMRYAARWRLTNFHSEDKMPCSFKIGQVLGATPISAPMWSPDREGLMPVHNIAHGHQTTNDALIQPHASMTEKHWPEKWRGPLRDPGGPCPFDWCRPPKSPEKVDATAATFGAYGYFRPPSRDMLDLTLPNPDVAPKRDPSPKLGYGDVYTPESWPYLNPPPGP